MNLIDGRSFQVLSDEIDTSESSRQTSLKDKYMSLLEEKQNELDHLKHLAELVLSRPTTSTEEKTTPQDYDSVTGTSNRCPVKIIRSDSLSVTQEWNRLSNKIKNNKHRSPILDNRRLR
jgi:enolase